MDKTGLIRFVSYSKPNIGCSPQACLKTLNALVQVDRAGGSYLAPADWEQSKPLIHNTRQDVRQYYEDLFGEATQCFLMAWLNYLKEWSSSLVGSGKPLKQSKAVEDDAKEPDDPSDINDHAQQINGYQQQEPLKTDKSQQPSDEDNEPSTGKDTQSKIISESFGRSPDFDRVSLKSTSSGDNVIQKDK